MYSSSGTHLHFSSAIPRHEDGKHKQAILLLNWVRAAPDRPLVSYWSSSQTRLIGQYTGVMLVDDADVARSGNHHPQVVKDIRHCTSTL
jgi:hypothetical protein